MLNDSRYGNFDLLKLCHYLSPIRYNRNIDIGDNFDYAYIMVKFPNIINRFINVFM